jgi:hypothetical protein
VGKGFDHPQGVKGLYLGVDQ